MSLSPTNHDLLGYALGCLRQSPPFVAEARARLKAADTPQPGCDDEYFLRYYAVTGLVLAHEKRLEDAIDTLYSVLAFDESDWGSRELRGLTMFNLGLILLVANKPPGKGTQLTVAQMRATTEAACQFSGAAHALLRNGMGDTMRGHAGSALSLLAEALVILGRTREALEAVEQSNTLLNPALGNQARRLCSNYGIQKHFLPDWQHPAGYNAHVNPPGTYNIEELIAYPGAK